MIPPDNTKCKTVGVFPLTALDSTDDEEIVNMSHPIYLDGKVDKLTAVCGVPMTVWYDRQISLNVKATGTGFVGTSNQAIYCNLQNICFSLLIDLDTLIIMSPKIDAPYLWIRPLGLVPLNLAYRLL